MSISRIVGILALIATALTMGASLVGQIKPQYAVYMMAVAGAITAFSERVQGGKSKV